MLTEYVRQIVRANPEYAGIAPVIEKEILHHDIIDVLVKQEVMQSLTFIGGTSLRLCYNSSRLSEDLDFNGGHGFKPSDFDGLDNDIQTYLQHKYEIDVQVNKPNPERQGNTSSWKISIVKEANRPDLPHQKLYIDICAIPSFDAERRTLVNHYNVVVPTEGLLIPVQSLEETLADKFIALAYRARRIKPRDVWDIVWIKQRGVDISIDLVKKKLRARDKTKDDFDQALDIQVNRLLKDDNVRKDFNAELGRFIPLHIKTRTLDDPDYWAYVQSEIRHMAGRLIHNDDGPHSKFDMNS